MSARTLFFALWPDDRQRDRLRDVINVVAKTVEGKPVERRNWHVTLAYVGQFPEDSIGELRESARRIQVEPFKLSFNRLEYWPRPKIAALMSPTVPAELQTLVSKLNEVLVDIGVMPDDRTYRPHITVVRGARPFSTERLAHRAATQWSRFELIESVAGPGGVRYRPLKQ